MVGSGFRPKKSSARSATTWPEASLRIIRYPSLSESQFLGCASAFADSLTGELNAATLALRRLENQAKGAAFALEMSLDSHRYGALIVLDRWSTVLGAFGPHARLAKETAIATGGPERVRDAEEILGRANQVIDGAERYSTEVVEACVMAFQAVQAAFAQERAAAEESARLGPMLPEEYREARRIFLEDLAAR